MYASSIVNGEKGCQEAAELNSSHIDQCDHAQGYQDVRTNQLHVQRSQSTMFQSQLHMASNQDSGKAKLQDH